MIFNFGHLVVLVGLWNMSASVLPLAYVLYGLFLLLDIVTLNLLGAIVSFVILGYLLSVSDKFD